MTTASVPSLLIIDDHAILLEGLGIALKQDMPDLEVHTASSIHAALQQALAPTGIVVDIKLPGLNGLDGVTLLKKRWPLARLVMLSAQDDEYTRNNALERGVHCFLSKAESSPHIVARIRALLLAKDGEQQPAARGEQDFLTARQCEVLELLCDGLSNKLIARELKLSDNTVRRHVQDILGYFAVSNRTEAVFEARRRGYVR